MVSAPASDVKQVLFVLQIFCRAHGAPHGQVCGKRGPELDDDELLSLSKRLVEDAVSRAVQQYMEETQQNGSAPKDEAPSKTTPK
ncbi:hypothetical protein PDJAM_G00192670 [Pangasius djambal]|uniref:Uncharacterized protein n=1 Tax=Pangasius djambal TaxID=1691987 RepID=A0ACC5ZPR5_9TELE|nr:hypothetical protein [Pangasius djambal]